MLRIFAFTSCILVLGCSDEPCAESCPYEIVEGYCSESRLDPLSSFDVTSAEWSSTRCTSAEPGEQFPFLVEGQCETGGQVLYAGTGFTIERRFYDADGKFVALETGSDVANSPCSKKWPEPNNCKSAEVTRVICGGASFSIGDPIPF